MNSQVETDPDLEHNQEQADSTYLEDILLELKQLHRLLMPKLLTSVVFYVQSFVSVYFTGMLGRKELAACSFAVGFANIFGYSILTGLAQGIESICGQSYGGDCLSLVGLALQKMVVIMLGCCVLLSVLWTNMTTLLTSLHNGLDHEMLDMAQIFLNFLLPDLIAQSLLLPLEIYLRSQQLTKPVMYTSIFSAALHVPTNMLLLYHFELGIRGVAIARFVTDFIHIVLLSIYLYCSGACERTWIRPTWTALRGLHHMLSLAAHSCVAVAIEWWWYEIILLAAGFLPDAEANVASMGILIRLTAMTYTWPSSLAAAVSTRIANELGANNPSKARTASTVATAYSFLGAFLACGFTVSVQNRWGHWFTGDSTTLSLTSMALPVVGLCELGNYPQTVAYGILMGSSRPNISVIVYSIAFYLVGLPTAITLGFCFQAGLVGFWYGLLAAQVTCAVLMVSAVQRTSWTEQAHQTQARLLLSSVSSDHYRESTASLLK